MKKFLVFILVLIVILGIISIFKNEPVCIISDLICVQISKIKK